MSDEWKKISISKIMKEEKEHENGSAIDLLEEFDTQPEVSMNDLIIDIGAPNIKH